jgi:hypothetical protein
MNKKKIKAVLSAETALAINQTETFSRLSHEIFVRPVVNSLALAHIKKAILNIGVVVELAKTHREAEICLQVAKKLNDLALELNDRPEHQTSLDKEERRKRRSCLYLKSKFLLSR